MPALAGAVGESRSGKCVGTGGAPVAPVTARGFQQKVERKVLHSVQFPRSHCQLVKLQWAALVVEALVHPLHLHHPSRPEQWPNQLELLAHTPLRCQLGAQVQIQPTSCSRRRSSKRIQLSSMSQRLVIITIAHLLFIGHHLFDVALVGGAEIQKAGHATGFQLQN